MFEKIPFSLKNKHLYILVLVVAGVWFVFFDQNNLIQQHRLSRQIKELEKEKEYYRQQIVSDSIHVDMLQNDPEELERYAREKYLMKKEGEDIFIVLED